MYVITKWNIYLEKMVTLKNKLFLTYTMVTKSLKSKQIKKISIQKQYLFLSGDNFSNADYSYYERLLMKMICACI